MSNRNSWEEMSIVIQKRSVVNTPLEIKSAKNLRAEILKALNIALDEKILLTKLHEIQKRLKLQASSVIKQKGYSEIMGGEKNSNRNELIPHFKLNNGCWFDFAITIDETVSPAEIIAFDFEIRYPPEISNWFLRFDLNTPNHENDNKNMRFHFHPNNEDIQIHSPPMSPLEILHLFLYGIKIPEKQRS